DDYEFLQEAEDFENEQFNMRKKKNLEIESLVNLDAEKIMS
ncbi:944_t:CDS:1, partial [Funneliformis mosseae]